MRNVERRLADLERLLGHRHHEKSTEFERQVLLWLLGNDEYRSVAREIFERCCQTEELVISDPFEATLTAAESERIRRLTAEAVGWVRAEFVVKRGRPVRVLS